MTTTFRPATNDDLDLLLDLAVAMHAESPRYSKLEFSAEKMINLFVQLIEREQSFILVIERDNILIGLICAMISEHFFSHDLVANDLLVYVLPEHRGGSLAKTMLNMYVAWAKANGAKLIQAGISTGINLDRTAQLYESLGFQQCSIGFEVTHV